MDYDFETQKPKTSGTNIVRKALILGGFAFLLGVMLMGWAVTRWEPVRRLVVGSLPTVAADPGAQLDEASGIVTTPITAPIVPPEAVDKVEALEQRLEEIDRTADAASGNAGRAEALLVAFAARRAVDRGMALGYLEAALQQRFGVSQPRAVGVLITESRRPVTLAALNQELAALGPKLTGGGAAGNWWDSLKSALSNLVVVRQPGAPSPVPAERLARAELLVEAGRVDGAIAEISGLPGVKVAGNWLKDARRYVESHRALDILEASAIMATSQPAAAPPAEGSAAPTPTLVPVPADESL